jgi:hypothetical protein
VKQAELPMNVQIGRIIAIILIATNLAHAASDAEGFGLHSCAKFGKDFQEDPAQVEIMYFTWAAGFLTGVNATSKATNNARRNLDAISPAEQRQFMRRYCASHPLNNYADGVFELLEAFPYLPEEGAK